MRIVSLLLVFSSFSVVSAQEGKKEEQPKIPATLSDAHAELERLLPPEELAKIDAMESEEGMLTYHFGLGMSIRNKWGLWTGSPLQKHMRELGFTHPDDMSGVILSTFWCKRHGQDFRLKERAAECRKYWEPLQKRADKEEKIRVEQAKAAMRKMMMGLRFEKRDVPTVRMPDRTGHFLSARFLSSFRGGVFITAYLQPSKQDDTSTTEGFYFDPTDHKIHRIRVEEVNDIHSAVVAASRAWFVGTTNGKAVLVGVNGQDRATLPLPLDGEPPQYSLDYRSLLIEHPKLPKAGQPPQLGLEDQSLLAVYPTAIFRLTGGKWTLVLSGYIQLPHSGPPPQRHGNVIFFRGEGGHENTKRLWSFILGWPGHIAPFDWRVGVVGPSGPRWENVFSYCVSGGDLWVCVGESGARKSLLRQSEDGHYSIAIMNNSVQFTEDLSGSKETDQGLSVSAVTALPDDTILLVGDAGLYRLKGSELVQELAFTNTHQEIPTNDGRVLHWSWDPSNVLMIDDKSYIISGASGGVYLLSKSNDGRWNFASLDENLGDAVVW